MLAEVADELVGRVWREGIVALVINGMTLVLIVIIVVLVAIIVSRFLEFLRHWWESDTLWEVWEGVN